MEVPVINRLSNFNGGSSSLISSVGALQAQSLLKWSAFIIAVLASFGTLITRARFLILRLQCRYSSTSNPNSSEPLLNHDDFSDYSSDEDDEEDDDDDEIDQDDSDSWSEEEENDYKEEIFNVRDLCRTFSWSDFSTGRSVVKLWDSFGLAYEEDEDLDGNSDSARRRVEIGAWDKRVGGKIPAILAEWGPEVGRIVGVVDGGRKVYVSDDVTGRVAIGDLRRFDSPYCIAESGRCDSAVTRCCSSERIN